MPYTPPLIQTSAQLAAQLSDETGSGLAVFGTAPTITLANGTGLPVSGITASTSTALGVGSIELGAASDTTIARSGAGAVTVEGVQVILSGAALGTPSSGTLTNCTALPVSGITASTSTALGVGSIELGHASDTTIARSGAGAVTVEGVQVILSGAALGTPSSGTLTNCTFPTLNQNTSGSAASLSVSGQTGLVTVVGLASNNRAKTVRDAADTILELGGSYTPSGTWTSMTLVTPALGTPASGVLTSCTGTADGLTAGDVTRNHAVYAGASPPTVDVGLFTISKTGVNLKASGNTTGFVVPTGRAFICTASWALVTAVTTPGAGTQNWTIKESGANATMLGGTVSGSATPAVGNYYSQTSREAGGPYTQCAAGNTVTIVLATSHAGSTAVTGTVFIQGFYSA